LIQISAVFALLVQLNLQLAIAKKILATGYPINYKLVSKESVINVHSADISLGKCYTITFENGRQLEYDSESNFYIASGSTGGHESGPFKLCVENNECEEGSNTEAIFAFSLLDIRGSPNNGNGVEGKTWLSGGFRGTPISRTSDWLTAAGLVVYRMPGEKSCLTSANGGLSSVNVSGKIGATVTEDTRDCIPVTLTEVSCDVQNQDNSGFQRQGSR
jgi:hypothetical protein